MKRRSAAPEVFSMSALDLFASAMGAFILIAVIALPYYKNETRIKYQLPHLDVVIVLDTTGSMKDVIGALKRELGGMAKLLKKLAPSVGMGIVGFNDQKQTPAEYSIFPLQKISAGDALQRLESALAPIEAGRASGDNPWDGGENLAGGVKLAMQSPWRDEAEKRIILLVTDDVPHPGTEEQIVLAASGFAAKGKKSVTGVNVGDIGKDENRHAAVKAFLLRLKEAGKGEYVETNSSLVAPLLLGALTSS